VGLYHTAILYPTKRDLGDIVRRLESVNYPMTGASDHGVSLAIYLNDPDGNGVELYWDRPKEEWPFDANGNLEMITAAIDWDDLMKA
jgi:catechol 2,3-dioxygenase